MNWTVSRKPINYSSPDGKQWVIWDANDGDVHNFYATEDEANAALKILLKGREDTSNKEVTVIFLCSLRHKP